MRIIQIVGRSNSGKTTFINRLIPVLKQQGTVAVVKHLGDHEFSLEAGKDTTDFFNNGADIAAGIDSGKSVIAFHKNTLEETLRILYKEGIDFVLIEGFKTKPYKKIVIGDLSIDNYILRNPSFEQVMDSLDEFEEYYTK